MKALHTPGPWHAIEFNVHAATTIVSNLHDPSQRTVIAECAEQGRYSNDCLADARLIAAAPELLVALRAMLERSSGDYWPIEQQLARDAIAKAVGTEQGAS